jgi:hypothetical protein
MTEYGIRCAVDAEARLVKNVNDFLRRAYGYRKMSKQADDSISAFNYAYCYCQFTKDAPRWFFDLFPNEDLDGQRKFEDEAIGWVLFTAKNDVEEYTREHHAEVDVFFEELIAGIGFETAALHRYADGEERIGNLILE